MSGKRYDKKEIFEQSKILAKEKNLIFIEDIINFLPLSKPTFYEYYPVGSNELNELKKILDENKVSVKVDLRKKWQVSDNATLQMALYKLMSNEAEHKKLATNYNENKNENREVKPIQVQVISEEKAEQIRKENE